MTTREATWSLWQDIREWPWDEKERPRPREFHIPAPEITSRDGVHAPIPKTAVRLARAAAGKNWTVRITCARGPLLHSTQDRVLRTVDSVAVRAVRGAAHAVGLWVDGKFKDAWAWRDGGLPAGLGAAEVLEHVKRGDGTDDQIGEHGHEPRTAAAGVSGRAAGNRPAAPGKRAAGAGVGGGQRLALR